LLGAPAMFSIDVMAGEGRPSTCSSGLTKSWMRGPSPRMTSAFVDAVVRDVPQRFGHGTRSPVGSTRTRSTT
jgi:hypothetical protein